MRICSRPVQLRYFHALLPKRTSTHVAVLPCCNSPGPPRGFPGAYFCIKALSETGQTEDLKKFDMPTPIIRGTDTGPCRAKTRACASGRAAHMRWATDLLWPSF